MSVPELYDAIVIGTGAGGGMAIKTLCEAGLKVCAINAGRRLDPNKDFRNHRKPWDMKFRGFGDRPNAPSPTVTWTNE
jgi:choline dehydrogenase-like flavoprotein